MNFSRNFSKYDGITTVLHKTRWYFADNRIFSMKNSTVDCNTFLILLKNMRNLRYTRSSTMLESQRRLSLNTVVLPPLPPAISESGAEILEKILVNKSKPNAMSGDLVTVTRAQDVTVRTAETSRPTEASRVAQLEQNIRFLQEQHQHMLIGLHLEIDSLRHRNRELQFQLVFAKASLPSTPSSPEDDTKHKVYTSPKQVNVTPLQVEILERELSEMKLQLQEAESRNVYLSAIVDEQKKKLERYERDRERERERGIQPDPELLRKLDDAEALIRRLRRENSDLRENTSNSPPTNYNNSSRDAGNYHRDGQSQKASGQNRGNPRHRGNGTHYRNWFPPLNSQSYWQNGRSLDKNGTVGGDGGSSLPTLQSNSASQYQMRRGGNNNHYHGDGRKFRGGQSRGHKPS